MEAAADASSPQIGRLSRSLSMDDMVLLQKEMAPPRAESRWRMACGTTTANVVDDDFVDETESVGSGTSASVAYFDSADFLPSNWDYAVVHMLPPAGLAALATGLALLHPLVFVAGALTAVGTFTVAGASVDACSSVEWTSDWWEMLSWPFGTSRGSPLEDNETEMTSSRKSNDTASTRPEFSEITIDRRLDFADHAEPCAIETDLGDTTSPKVIAIQQTTRAPLPPLPTKHKLTEQHPRSLEAREDLKAWTKEYYPALSNEAHSSEKFYGINALEFFQVFFSDRAPYTFQKFQERRKDKDIVYGPWKKLSQDEVRQASMHSEAKALPTSVSINCAHERLLTFDAKTNSLLGPPYAKTTKKQRALRASKRLLVLESRTSVENVPFSSRFYVMERWVVTAQKEHHKGCLMYVSTLDIHSQVFFTESCPFEAKITSTSKSTIGEIAKAWCQMAQEALHLSEESRFHRIAAAADDASLVGHEDDDGDDNEVVSDENKSPRKMLDAQSAAHKDDIEVQHLRGSHSFVVGEEKNATPNTHTHSLMDVSDRTVPKRRMRRRPPTSGVLMERRSDATPRKRFPSMDRFLIIRRRSTTDMQAEEVQI